MNKRIKPIVAYHANSGTLDAQGLPRRSFGGGTPGGLQKNVLPRVREDIDNGLTRFLCHLFVCPRVEAPKSPMRRDGGQDAIDLGLEFMVEDGWETIHRMLELGAEEVIVYNGTDDKRLKDLSANDPSEYVDRVWASYGPGVGNPRISFASDAFPYVSTAGLTFDAFLVKLGHKVYAEPFDPKHRLPVILEEWWYDSNLKNNPQAQDAIAKAPEVCRWLNASSSDSKQPQEWLAEVAAAGHTPIIQTYREFSGWSSKRIAATLEGSL